LSEGLEFKGRIVRSPKDEMKIHQGQYYGIKVLDVRWYRDDKPTRKGIRMNMNEAKVLRRLLNKLLDGEEE
jgi:phosphodiesterase/alkaline phosphatase D-like protein